MWRVQIINDRYSIQKKNLTYKAIDSIAFAAIIGAFSVAGGLMMNTHNDKHTAFSDYGKSITIIFMLVALGARAYNNNPTTPQDDIQESLIRIFKLDYVEDSGFLKPLRNRDHCITKINENIKKFLRFFNVDYVEDSGLLKSFSNRNDYITNINDLIQHRSF